MRPEPVPHELLRDPILDGRDSLRLVRLRLALTLIAVAILPIAAVAPLVRAVAEEARVSHERLLTTHAVTASEGVAAEVGAIRVAASKLLADPAIVAAAKPRASDAAAEEAAARLATLTARPTGVVRGVVLVTAEGARAAAGAPLNLAALGAQLLGPATVGAGEGPAATVLLAMPADARLSRSLVIGLSPSTLLATTLPPAQLPGQSVLLLDPDGAVLARTEGPFDAGALAGEVIDIATMAGPDIGGRTGIAAPGFEGWHLVVDAPLPLVALPAQALAALVVMLLLLVAFTLWMARQILRPAVQLEASRSHLRELYESAREAALRDSLTGLGNHRAFQEAVARMVEGARRYGTAFSLVLIDIDEFKRVNDTHGHAIGDQLLAEVGNLIQSAIRQSDSGFRIGGDEFAILLPHTEADGAVVVTRRLLSRALEGRSHGRYSGPISFSAGITACPEFGATRLELTAQADAALYRGKRSGRTVATVFDPARDRGHMDEGMRAELSSAITTIIESGGLLPIYQPVVELATGRVIAFEGLVRLPRESLFAHAGALFDAAEVAGRVVELDRAALDVVLRGARDLAPDVALNVNVSPRTLESDEFNAATFLGILRRHGMSPDRIVMELTERESVRDPERLKAALRGLQGAGVRVAADDVGAGNAGLRLLSQFRFDVVKIDLSLVQRASEGQTGSVLRSLVDMAHRLGAETIAEGVETAAELRTIRELGITAGQGYLLGRPGESHHLSWVDLVDLEEQPQPKASPRPVGVPVAASRPTFSYDPDAVPLPGDPTSGEDRLDRPAPTYPRWLRPAPEDESSGAAAARSRSIALLNTARASNE